MPAAIDAIRLTNQRTAELGCTCLDSFVRGGLTPRGVYDAQDGLRRQLLHVQGRLRKLKLLAAQAQKGGTPKDDRRAIAARLREEARLLRRQEVILRVIADGIAWLALDEDPRVLVPLYKAGTKGLPPAVSIAGPLSVIARVLDTEKFLVIENDLTRCLGVGDLTIVFANRPWKRPVSLEVKTSGTFIEGARLEVQGIMAHSDHPADEELVQEFREAAGLGDLPEHVEPRDEPDQTAEMLARAELLLGTTEGRGSWIPSVSRRLWETIARVLLRGLADGASWDLAEPGVAVFAIRAQEGRALHEEQDLVRHALEELGFDFRGALTSEDFLRHDAWSALARPIPLWPVALSARAALLTGKLVYGCSVLESVWVDALRHEGVELLQADGGSLLVSGRRGEARVEPLEQMKLLLGVALSGFSPKEVARRLAAVLGEGTGE